MIGIYKITNTVNGKVYIGQSTDINRRISQHFSRAFNPASSEYNCLIGKAIRKYGKDAFIVDTIVECEQQELNVLEQKYIIIYNANDRSCGYNMTLGGDHATAGKLTATELINIETLLRTTTLTMAQIGKQFNVSENMICGINTGYYYKRDIVYPIRQKYIPTQHELAEDIKTLTLTSIANKYTLSENTIRKLLLQYNLPTPAAYKRNLKQEEVIKQQESEIAKEIEHFDAIAGKNYNFSGKAKPVIQLDLEDNIVAKYPSCSAAASHINPDNIKSAASSIGKVCNGTRKTYKNYKWKWDI